MMSVIIHVVKRAVWWKNSSNFEKTKLSLNICELNDWPKPTTLSNRRLLLILIKLYFCLKSHLKVHYFVDSFQYNTNAHFHNLLKILEIYILIKDGWIFFEVLSIV